MALIRLHLDRELNKSKKDKQTVSDLQEILSKGSISFGEWQLSGKFIPVDSFAEECPEVPLHEDCVDVILYFGDIIIQVLKTDTFFVYPKFHTQDIKLAEKELWHKNIGNFFQ